MTLFIIISFFFCLKMTEGCFIILDWAEKLKNLTEISCSINGDRGQNRESKFEVQWSIDYAVSVYIQA